MVAQHSRVESLYEQLARNNHLEPDFEAREIILGYIRGEPDYAPLISYLLSGQPNQGKTVILSHLCSMFVLAGARLIILDPHHKNQLRGLYPKIAALSPWIIGEPLDFREKAPLMDRLEGFFAEYQDRISHGLDGRDPQVLVVDEFNGLMTMLDDKQRKRVQMIVSEIARGGPKWGCFIVVAAHDWKQSRTGDVRSQVPGRICVSATPRSMALALDVEIADLADFHLQQQPLRKLLGEAIVFRPDGFGLTRMRFPLTTPEDCQAVAELMSDLEREWQRPRWTPVLVGGSGEGEARNASLTHLSLSSEPDGSSAPHGGECALPAHGGRILSSSAPPTRHLKAPEAEPEQPEAVAAVSALGVQPLDVNGKPIALPWPLPELSNARGKKLTIHPWEWRTYIMLGNEQIVKTRHVERTKIRDSLSKPDGKAGNSYDYEKIQAVCEYLNWHQYMDLEWSDGDIRDILFSRYNYTCLCCGARAPEVELHADHIQSRDCGGTDAIWNRQPLCEPCNSRKGITKIDYRPKAEQERSKEDWFSLIQHELQERKREEHDTP